MNQFLLLFCCKEPYNSAKTENRRMRWSLGIGVLRFIYNLWDEMEK